MLGTLSRPLPKGQIRRFMLVYFGVILVLLAFPIRNSYHDFQQARREVAAQEQLRTSYLVQKNNARNAETERPIVIGEIGSAVDQLAGFDRHMTARAEWPQLIQEVRGLTESGGLHLVALNPVTPAEKEGFQTFRINLRAEGTFVRLVQFLHQMRTNPTIYLVDDVQITSLADGSRPPRLNLNVELRTFLIDDPMDIPAIRRALADTAFVGAAGAPHDSTYTPQREGEEKVGG